MLCVLGVLAGCDLSGRTLYQQLQDENPQVRFQAVKKAGQRKDQKAVPYLVDRLTDPERPVRLFAIIALEKITNQTMGYRHYTPAAERAEAVKRWRQWLKDRSGRQSATRPGQRSRS